MSDVNPDDYVCQCSAGYDGKTCRSQSLILYILFVIRIVRDIGLSVDWTPRGTIISLSETFVWRGIVCSLLYSLDTIRPIVNVVSM
jgi:hypothetical protein